MKNNYRQEKINTQVLVIGSGAGGAVTAATLAKAGFSVIVAEEGQRINTENISTHSTEAMKLLYRNRGMTPIFGNTTIAFVEGSCVGGSTEVNSAFWHRTPEEAIKRWIESEEELDIKPARSIRGILRSEKGKKNSNELQHDKSVWIK